MTQFTDQQIKLPIPAVVNQALSHALRRVRLLSEAEARLSEMARRVHQQHDRIVLTRNERAEAGLLPVDDLDHAKYVLKHDASCWRAGLIIRDPGFEFQPPTLRIRR